VVVVVARGFGAVVVVTLGAVVVTLRAVVVVTLGAVVVVTLGAVVAVVDGAAAGAVLAGIICMNISATKIVLPLMTIPIPTCPKLGSTRLA
jgi:hypothetical protein